MRSETSALGVQIQKIKNELERRYQLIIKILDFKIDYDYFTLISDYVDWIENSEILKKILYSAKYFKK